MARIRTIKPESPSERWRHRDLFPPDLKGSWLYRMVGHDGELLYVGITRNPVERWRCHARTRQWWSRVAEIRIQAHPSEGSALAAERLAIREERPLHNVRSAVR